MSDYRDILLKALKEGKTMDSCGLDERYYDFGLYTDLCGMSVEDAIKSVTQCCCGGGGSNTGSTKTNNPIIITAEENGEGKYAVKVKAAYATTAPVIVTFTIDGQNVTATIPAGASETTVDGVVLDTQYATIGKIDVTSTDEVYKYTVSANIADGLFVLTYKIDGKTVHELKIKVGTKIEKFEPEAKTGYLFKGWVPAEPETMPDKDITIVAKYQINVHKVTYFVDDVKVHEQEYSYHATIAEYNYTKEGYTISAWVGLPADMLMPDEDLEIHATSVVNEYDVIFNVDGTEYETKKVAYGAAITVPTDEPTKTGYTFKQWVGIPGAMPAHNVTIEAEFTINSYTLTFKNGADVVKTYTVEYGAALADYASQAMALVPEKTGFTFSWDSAVPATMPAEDVVIEGSYKEKTAAKCYYGKVLTENLSALTFDNMVDFQEYTPGTMATFVIPKNEEFAKYNDIYLNSEDDNEANAAMDWMNEFHDANRNSLTLVYPTDKTLVKVIDGKDDNETKIFTVDHTIEKDGVIYNVLANHPEKKGFPNGYSPAEKDTTFLYKFILN